MPEAATTGVLLERKFLNISQSSQENTCTRAFFLKKETLAQAFSCEFCEISENAFFTDQLLTTASDVYVT